MSGFGPFRNEITGPVSAFGEVCVIVPNPIVQIDSVRGVLDTDVETFVDAGASGSASASGGQFVMTTGTAAGGYGVVRSIRALRYRTGQGALNRITCVFDTTAPASSLQLAGMFNLEDGLFFGYDGADFGVCRRTGGLATTVTLTLSAAASGAETATVTLNGVEFTPSLTAGTAAFNAKELAAATYTDWNVAQNGDTVVFTSRSVGVKAGAYTLTSTGTAAGTFAVDQAGVAHTYNWVKQTAWNVDKMDGRGPSRQILDPSKGNVYQIGYQWLGYGAQFFAVEDSKTGAFQIVHVNQYANLNTTPSLRNPTMKIGWAVASLGSTTALTIKGSSAAGFVEGAQESLRPPRARSNTKTGIGTSPVNVLTIRNRGSWADGSLNHHEIVPLRVSISSELSGNNTGTASVYLNPDVAGDPNFAYEDSSNSLVEYDTAGTTVTNGTLIVALGMAKADSQVIDLEPLGVRLAPGDRLVVAFTASGGTAESTAALTWRED